jgi:hypothetical protein
MNKIKWRKICNMTAHASNKRRLTKKELGELMQAQIALGAFKGQGKAMEGTWQAQGKKEPVGIGAILSTFSATEVRG